MAMSKQRRALAAALEALDRADMNGLPGLTPAYIAIGEALAELEQSTAVEPAQAAIKCKEPAQAVPFAWVLECMTSIGTTCWMLSWNRSGVGSCNRLHGQDHEKPLYTAPPAIVEAVPVGRVLHWKGDPGFAPKTCIRGFDEFPHGYAQLGPWEEGENVYTAPPAIDEIRHRLILVCEYLETVGLMFVSPRVISSQIRAILEAGNEN